MKEVNENYNTNRVMVGTTGSYHGWLCVLKKDGMYIANYDGDNQQQDSVTTSFQPPNRIKDKQYEI